MDKRKAAAAGDDEGFSFAAMSKDEFVGRSHSQIGHRRDENQAAADNQDEELNSAVAAMSIEEKLEFWTGLIARDSELATTLFFSSILQDAADDYKPRPKPRRFSAPRRPPIANRPGPPPVTTVSSSSRVTVQALRAPPGSHLARDLPNNRTPSTTTAAAQGNEPHGTPIAPRRVGKEGLQDPTHADFLLVPPSTSDPDEAPPQNSFNTVTVPCAPPHLARELMRPSTSTEGWVLSLPAQQAKKQHDAE